MSQTSVDDLVEARSEYSAGFVTDIDSDTLAPGLDEDTVRFISARKDEPQWLTDWRLKAFAHWKTMPEPTWAHVHYPPINFQDISYYSAPKSQADGPQSLDEVDPELLRTYEKLGIPLHEQAVLAGVVNANVPQTPNMGSNVAVDVVFDSVSIATTFKEKLAEAGVIFLPYFRSRTQPPRTHPKIFGQRYSAKR